MWREKRRGQAIAELSSDKEAAITFVHRHCTLELRIIEAVLQAGTHQSEVCRVGISQRSVEVAIRVWYSMMVDIQD